MFGLYVQQIRLKSHVNVAVEPTRTAPIRGAADPDRYEATTNERHQPI